MVRRIEFSIASRDRWLSKAQAIQRCKSGHYDVDVRWTPGPEDTLAGAGEPLPVASEPSGLFRAIQEQLGLKLESRRAPVNVVVVDHVERVPAAN